MIMGGQVRLPAGRADPIAAEPTSPVNVKRVRRLLDLSQSRLADLMNLPLRWVQDLEQGRNGITAANRLLFKTVEMFPDAVAEAAEALRSEDEMSGTSE